MASGAKAQKGWDLLRNPYANRGLAASDADRDKAGTRGLLPPGVVVRVPCVVV